MSERLGFAIRRLENSLCQSSKDMVPLSKQGKIRQRKGRGDRLRLSFAVPKIQWDSTTPLPLCPYGYYATGTSTLFLQIKLNGYTFKGTNSTVGLYFYSFIKGWLYLKKRICPLGANSFLEEHTLFRKGAFFRKTNRKSQKLLFFVKLAEMLRCTNTP